ncbi:kinase-like domain-containing protein [Chlamydoabsidia padenii]|nr:kinase-like domain-containing protein [Chlamydoabsidia padenii]
MTRWFNPASLHFSSSSWNHSPFRTRKSSQYRHVKHYRLLYELAQGSTCIVYLALDTKTKKYYAIKEMNKARLQRQLCLDWLQSRHPKQQNNGCKRRRIDPLPQCLESDLLHSLHHPHLVNWIDYFEDTNYLYLVTDYVNGSVIIDLHQNTKTPLDLSLCHSIFTQLVALLEYLHEQNIIHGDIKPDNILLTKDNQIKLIDFGSAIQLNHTNHTIIRRTPAFTPPECTTTQSNNETATDIWCLGMTLYCMVYGKLPYDSSHSIDLYHHIATLTSIPHESDTMDPQLCHLIDQMLKISPTDRITLDQIKCHPWFMNPTA